MKKAITLLITGVCVWNAHAQQLGRITFSSGGGSSNQFTFTLGEPLSGSFNSADGNSTLTIGAQVGSRNVSPQDSLSLNNYTLNVSNIASSPVVELNSNRSWIVNNPSTWVTVSPMSGSKSASLNLSISANSLSTNRTATITIIAGSNVKTLTINQAASVGANELVIGNEMKIFPNPANSEINIWVNEKLAKGYAVKITDLNGKVVIESVSQTENLLMPVSHLAPGNYLINVSNNQTNFNKTIKIFKSNN